MHELIENLSRIDAVVAKNELLTRKADRLRSEHGVKKPEQLEADFQTIMQEGRLLRLGVIGRVKAGKSSLLNALFFQGENVLPKAATPMTAALSILTYAEERGLEVDYYSAKDQDEIRKTAAEYDDALREKSAETLKSLEETAKKSKREGIDKAELEQRAERQAKRELDEIMSAQKAAWQQYAGMKARGSAPDHRGREPFRDSAEMNARLKELVSAEGAETHFTKSVTLYLPEDQLRDVEIIDTPGTNDPVVSREQRTRDLLATCDVVFVVCPAGQFLSAEDMDLMNRVHSKEGVQEFYLIASQVDNQLYGSEKAAAGGRLSDVLERVRGNLAAHAQGVIEAWTVPGSESIRARMLALGRERLFCTASIGYGLEKNAAHQDAWDENEHHVWKQLCRHYPDHFSDADIATSRASLNLLTGIEPIRDAFADVRRRKDEIAEEKRRTYAQTEARKITDFQAGLKKGIEQRIDEIRASDVDQLRKQQREMQASLSEAKAEIDEVYTSLVEDFCSDLKKTVNTKHRHMFNETLQGAEGARESTTETYEHDKGNIFERGLKNLFSRYETRIREVETVNAGAIYSRLRSFCGAVRDTLDDEIDAQVKAWRKSVSGSLVPILREHLGDADLNIAMIKRTLREVMQSVEVPNMEPSEIPSALQATQTLRGSDAGKYMAELYRFVPDVQDQVKRDVTSYLKNLKQTLIALDCSEKFLANFHEQVEQLVKEIENQEITIDRYNRSLNALKEL